MGTYINKIFPLPYICQDGTQKYPVPMMQSLQFALYEAAKLLKNYVQISVHTEFRDLVEALMSSDKALKEVDPGSSAITALTCSRLEAQKNMNTDLDTLDLKDLLSEPWLMYNGALSAEMEVLEDTTHW